MTECEFISFDRHKARLADFDCGVPPLNRYLQKYAGQNHKKKISRCTLLVPTDDRSQVIGYFTLSNGSVEKAGLPPASQKHLPNYPVPVVLLGRLAVDNKWRSKGFGAKLLMEALYRVYQAQADLGIGIKGVVVDAKDAGAAAFYGRYGFGDLQGSIIYPKRMFLDIDTIESALP